MNPGFGMLAPVKLTAIIAVALALGLAGCGGGGKPGPKPTLGTPTSGLVQGRLVEIGGPTPGDPRPISGTVTFKGPDGSVTKAEIDDSGHFSIGLSPGRYQIRGTSPLYNDGKATCSTDPPTTTLRAGSTVTANVVCSIR